MWELAKLCQRFHAMPFPGGAAEQPYGALLRMRALLAYSEDFQVYSELGNKAPDDVRRRVLMVMARMSPAAVN